MDHLHSGGVTPDDLIAYIDGEAPPAVTAHVAGCPECAARAREYARTQQQLRVRLWRFDCPPAQTLGEYVFDFLAPEERTRVAGHVIECPRCAEEVEQLRALLAADPPPPAGPVERLRRVVATLVPTPRGAYAGLRGAADPAARTYRAGELTIGVSAGPAGKRGRVSLEGLIWREDGGELAAAGGTASLSAPERPALTAAIDEFGNFVFEEIEPGAYDLELVFDDQQIFLGGVDAAR